MTTCVQYAEKNGNSALSRATSQMRLENGTTQI